MLMSTVARLKPYVRWLALGAALFFLLATLRQHWQAFTAIQITPATWAGLIVALGVTLLAHVWSGWVWHWILQALGIQVRGLWTTAIYLKTNIAKYLPGNVWHFYGRVRALQAAGATTVGATTGVLLEPVLMAAAALLLTALGSGIILQGGLRLALLGVLVITLGGIHPRLLNPVLNRLRPATTATPTERLQRYPFKALIGELGFVTLRGLGFALALGALQPLAGAQLLPVLSAFAAAWLLGLVIPGAPGGIGVFEAVAVALLQTQLPVGQVLSGVIAYRLVSTLAEAIGAGLIWLDHPSRELAIEAATPFLLPPAHEPPLSTDRQPDDRSVTSNAQVSNPAAPGFSQAAQASEVPPSPEVSVVSSVVPLTPDAVPPSPPTEPAA